MNVYLLTSSRADYGIYRPLIKELVVDDDFNLRIVVFGTHLSNKYGMTKNEILADGFSIFKELDTIPEGDSQYDISKSMAKTSTAFSKFWCIEKKVDLIICLGDRYEMFAAVSASIPYNFKVAHFHGGEITTGAIDNKFRNAITTLSEYHFTSTELSKERVKNIVGSSDKIFNVGAMGLDNVLQMQLFTNSEFYGKFGFNLNNPILCTIHPETVNVDKNESHCNAFVDALVKLKDQIIITMPNADTKGNVIRKILTDRLSGLENIHLVESFGTKGYFTCMRECLFLLGNTSSGIIEAASFEKFVINLGNRQSGRECSENVINVPFNAEEIFLEINKIKKENKYCGSNIYGEGKAAVEVVNIVKNITI